MGAELIAFIEGSWIVNAAADAPSKQEVLRVNSIIYLVGLVVIVLAVLSLLGIR